MSRARSTVSDRNLARRESLTVRQILDRVITWHRLVVGSPEQLADAIAEWYVAGAVDGFRSESGTPRESHCPPDPGPGDHLAQTGGRLTRAARRRHRGVVCRGRGRRFQIGIWHAARVSLSARSWTG